MFFYRKLKQNNNIVHRKAALYQTPIYLQRRFKRNKQMSFLFNVINKIKSRIRTQVGWVYKMVIEILFEK